MKQNEEGRPVPQKETPSLLQTYEKQIQKEIRVLIAEKGLSQKKVAYAMEKAGIKETPKGLSAKIGTGTFSAAYYLALKAVINSL